MGGDIFIKLKRTTVALAFGLVAACAAGKDVGSPIIDKGPHPEPKDKCHETGRGPHDRYEGSGIVGPRTVPVRRDEDSCFEGDSASDIGEEIELRAE